MDYQVLHGDGDRVVDSNDYKIPIIPITPITPANTIDSVCLTDINIFFAKRDIEYKFKFGPVLGFLCLKLFCVIMLPYSMYQNSNSYLMDLSCFLIVIVFAVYLTQFYISNGIIRRLISHMNGSVILLPYAKKIKYTGYIYLVNTIITGLFIIGYVITLSTHMDVFVQMTITYTIVIASNITGTAILAICENRYCLQLHLIALSLIHIK